MRKSPVRLYQDYEIDEDCDGTVTDTIKSFAAAKNYLVYEKHSLDVDHDEAKGQARAANKHGVVVVENDKLTPAKIYTREELNELQLELQKKLWECKTVKDLVIAYLVKFYLPRVEKLRMINTPSVVLVREKRFLTRAKAGQLIRTGEWENELVSSFIERTGYKGHTYLEITLRNGKVIRESKGRYGMFLRLA